MQELIDIISCVLLMHMKKIPSEHDDGSSDGGYPVPSNLKTEALVSQSETIYFIGCWLQAFEFFLERCNIYIFPMKIFFQKPVELPKTNNTKEKHQSLLYAIGGGWYVKKLSENLPP